MRNREIELESGSRIRLTSPRTRRKTVCWVGELLGEGGTARVYSGFTDDGGHLVLKTQRVVGDLDPSLELEVRLFTELNHRNIVACLGVGTTDEGGIVLGFRRAYPNPLLLMGHESVAEAMRRDRLAAYPSLPLDTAIDLGYELLNALAYLERVGLVHHDVKLANLLIDVAPSERPLEPPEVFSRVVRRNYRGVLIDFGATRTREHLEQINMGGGHGDLPPQITPLYAPPEAVVETRGLDGELARTFDASIDVYAAALVVYALVTGHPPYSHLREPIDARDFESIVSVKSAERRGDVQPVAGEVIERTVMEDTRFLQGDRATFDLALHRFLVRRLAPDPEGRGTMLEMKREFEKLMHIRPKAGQGSEDIGSRRGAARVFLPFEQELVRVGGGGGDHPLMRAARLHGFSDSGAGAPAPGPPQAAGAREELDVETLVDMVFVGDADTARQPRVELDPADEPATLDAPTPQARGRLDSEDTVDELPVFADEPRSLEEEQDPRRRKSYTRRSTRREPLQASSRESSIMQAFWGEGGLDASEENYGFRGKPSRLLLLQSLGILLTVLILVSGVLALLVTTLQPIPANLDPAAARLMRSLQALLAEQTQEGILTDSWHRLEPTLRRIHVALPWLLVTLLLGVWLQVLMAVKLFRIRNTYVFGEQVIYDPGFGLVDLVLNLVLFVGSAGLLTPWILARKVRRFYRSCRVPPFMREMDFVGTGRQAAGRLVLTLLALPFVVATGGLLGLALQYVWLRWEQSNIQAPAPRGAMCPVLFEGTLKGYLGQALKGWLLTIVSLGILRAWALCGLWRWFDARSRVQVPRAMV